jgi:hypothetical protein
VSIKQPVVAPGRPDGHSDDPGIDDLAYELQSNYQSRMGFRISRRGSKILDAWKQIARNCLAIYPDPEEFMDAMFLATANSHPNANNPNSRKTTPAGEGPQRKTMQNRKWCQRAWQQRANFLADFNPRPDEAHGQVEWRGLVGMFKPSFITKPDCNGDDSFDSEDGLEDFCSPLLSTPAVIRCAFSFNHPKVVAQFGKAAADYLRLRHGVARAMMRDGLLLPPDFVVPPQLLVAP